MAKQYQITFSGKDLELFEAICQQLHLSQSKAICCGLKFMALYAKTQTEKDTRLILDKNGDQRQLII